MKKFITSALKRTADFNETPDLISLFTIHRRYAVEKKRNLSNLSASVRAADRVVARQRSLFETHLRISKSVTPGSYEQSQYN